MNYIVAVSGGVDSVVLLDMMAKYRATNRIIVAHFDHGIRKSSMDDARFVEGLAKSYHLPFQSRREELGEKASEALARERRYIFLNELAKVHDAKIVTAHHQDDLIETIAINMQRGTGWRGLSVFGSETISRPLKTKRKSDLYNYALENKLEWVEDETNQSDIYLRNRLRKRLRKLDVKVFDSLLDLRNQQIYLRSQIEIESKKYRLNQSRYFFIMLPMSVALELLRIQTNSLLTGPQLLEVLNGIKTARPGAKLSVGAGVIVQFTKTHFTFENTSQLLY